MSTAKAVAVPNQMKREKIWTVARWAGKTDEEWYEMCSRLLSPPESNYKFWDWIEIEQMEEYASRGEQMKEYYKHHPHFNTNLANLSRALEYAYGPLAAKYAVLPGSVGKIGLKEAMRKGKVFECGNGSMMDRGPDEMAKFMKTMERVCGDLGMAIQLDEDPESISVERWHELKSGNPIAILDQALNRCSQELGIEEVRGQKRNRDKGADT